VVAWIGYQLFTERLPPNGFFGVRTRRTLSDVRFWYAANRAAGGYLLAAAVLAAGSVLALSFTGKVNWQLAITILISLVGIAVVLSMIWHERN
jgi:uncharacterized membrane protein